MGFAIDKRGYFKWGRHGRRQEGVYCMGTVEEKSHKTIDELFSEMEQAIADPQKTFEKYRSDNQKAIGCIPYFAPYELVDAARMYPLEL